MGFFSGYGTIGKIYSKLNVIERDLIEMRKSLDNPGQRYRFNSVSSSGLVHLKELMAIVADSNSTVKSADFEFAGRKMPIEEHLFNISEYMKQMMMEYTYNRR